MSANRIEQLEIALEIERANEAGTPIEWEWRTVDGIWIAGIQMRTTIYHIANSHEIRIKPWRIGKEINGHKLPEGAEWHRQDFTQDDLPPGYRPLLFGECDYTGDEVFYAANGWVKVTPCPLPNVGYNSKRRTTRPIPELEPEKWAAEKAAFAEGKVIQYRLDSYSRWELSDNPAWREIGEYRIKPEPRIVDLEPCDIEPGSVVRLLSWSEGCWKAVIGNCPTGVLLHEMGERSFNELRAVGWLIHRPSKPGIWERCEKEVAE